MSATLRRIRALFPAFPCRPGAAGWKTFLRLARRPFLRVERRSPGVEDHLGCVTKWHLE